MWNTFLGLFALTLLPMFIGYRVGVLDERWAWREGKRKNDRIGIRESNES